MLKTILFFIVIAVCFVCGVELFLGLSSENKKKVVKWFAFSVLYGIIALLFIFGVVFIF